MALNCENLLSADIQRDCDNNPIAGLEVNILFFNLDDVDKTATTFDATTDLIMSNFALKAGAKTGYLVEGVKANTFKALWELVILEYVNAYKHTIEGVILNPTAANRKQVEAMADGGKFCAIVEKKWKGASDADAFEIYGYDSGLAGATAAYNSSENGGVITFAMATEDAQEEPRQPYNVLETDYATTLAAFGTKWLSV